MNIEKQLWRKLDARCRAEELRELAAAAAARQRIDRLSEFRAHKAECRAKMAEEQRDASTEMWQGTVEILEGTVETLKAALEDSIAIADAWKRIAVLYGFDPAATPA